tara:strand:- start:791 stop:1114 length:324 start_codon:yes stop_codon:yes gene_type:complete
MTAEPIYFFAAAFPNVEGTSAYSRQFKDQLPRSVEVVTDSRGTPYRYLDEMTARRAHNLAKHHSGLYRLDPKEERAELVDPSHDLYLTPESILLSPRNLKILEFPAL